jgi:hypothetical protein
MPDEESCIFCLDNNNIIKNNKCSCNYQYHDTCWNVYILRSNVCPLCRMNIEAVHEIREQTFLEKIFTFFFLLKIFFIYVQIYWFK